METAIHTPTQKSYNKLMKKLEKQGYMWSYDEKPTDANNWGEEGGKTCINIDEATDIELQDTLSFCYKKWYEDKGYKIISVEEYLGEWKQGDILVDEEGYKCKILGICGELYFLSEDEDDDFSEPGSSYYTKEGLERLGYELKEEKDTIDITVEGETKTISKQSAKELNLI